MVLPSRVSSLLILALVLAGCDSARDKQSVVAYVSVDQIYSEPILKQFTQTTGIEVRAVYDVEASKTTGLVNRLIAEMGSPRADVYWNGEFVQTMLLKEKGVLAAYTPPGALELPEQYRDAEGAWTGVGGRLRVLLASADAPPVESLRDLLRDDLPAARVGIAYPLFGSSVTHAAALYAVWGPEAARQFYRELKDRGVRVVDGNATVRDLVVSGELQVGLTDSDDACGALARGSNVRIVPPDQEAGGTFLIPGSVAVIDGAPHPDEARRLADFLTSAETETRLLESGFCQLSLRESGPVAPCLGERAATVMPVSSTAVWRNLAESRKDLSEIFVR